MTYEQLHREDLLDYDARAHAAWLTIWIREIRNRREDKAAREREREAKRREREAKDKARRR